MGIKMSKKNLFKRLGKLFFLVLVLFLFFPSIHSIKSYQKGLWTYHKTKKGHRTNDLQFTNKELVDGLHDWNRVRLGFPFKSITIDSGQGVFQMRIESLALGVNLLIYFTLFGVIGGVISITILVHKKND